MKISCDFDNTLARTHDLICPLLSFKTGRTIRPSDVVSWDYFREHGLWDDFQACLDFIEANGLRKNLAPYDDSTYPVLFKLSTRHEVDVVTANNHAATRGIEEWLESFGISNIEVKCIGRRSATAKLALGYDLYIDDNPNMMSGPLLLPDQPWNRLANATRFHSWSEVPRLVDDFHDMPNV